MRVYVPAPLVPVLHQRVDGRFFDDLRRVQLTWDDVEVPAYVEGARVLPRVFIGPGVTLTNDRYPLKMRDQLYRNLRNGRFEDVSEHAGVTDYTISVAANYPGASARNSPWKPDSASKNFARIARRRFLAAS